MSRQTERALEEKLGVIFQEPALLRTALTHRSLLHERPAAAEESNERLEFLGDAFLGLLIAEEIYRRFPGLSEGGLTQMRSRLVRTETLAEMAMHLGIGECLRLGRGEEQSGGRLRERNLARALEAVFGALLLDQGYAAARPRVLALFEEILAALPEEPDKDYKSLLQEMVQVGGRAAPTYRTVSEEGVGPTRLFTVEVSVEGEALGIGRGGNKRKAEQAAAQAAYKRLAAERAIKDV